MKKEFYESNRKEFYSKMKKGSLAVLFSGVEIRKSNDEYYPFFTDRNFLYMTGIEEKEIILLAGKDSSGMIWEKLFLLPPDLMAERWGGARVKCDVAEEKSGIEVFGYVDQFPAVFQRMAVSGNYESLYLDLFKYDAKDINPPAFTFLKTVTEMQPYLKIENANSILRTMRLIKKPEEIEAMRRAEQITCEGITAMMKSSRPGMFEYQYKAEFDYVLGQYSRNGPGFPSIISAGKNNFCIHYYSYQGQAVDGDMILNDVGASYDGLVNDVSRGWPCNGKYTERQKLLYECALRTSDHMFGIIKPGMKMADVDQIAERYNYEQLKDAGVCDSYENIGTYMWHGGAHHVGFDCHDAVMTPEVIAPDMVFCVDIGIYHEEWGIGFRIEDNCLVTDNGCENLSQMTPRTIREIEDHMMKKIY